MRKFRDLSINRKLTLIIMVTNSAALLLACAVFVIYDQITFRGAMVRDLSIIAEIIGNNSAAALIFSDEEAAEDTLSAINVEPHIVSCYIYSTDGEVLARYIRNNVKEELLPPKPQEDSYRFEGNNLSLFQRIAFEGDIIGTVYIQSDMQELYSRQERYVGIVLIIMLNHI